MVKDVPSALPWRSLMLRHGDLKQRLYYPPARLAVVGQGMGGRATVPVGGGGWFGPCTWLERSTPDAGLLPPIPHTNPTQPTCSYVLPYQQPPLLANGVAAAARGVAKKPSKVCQGELLPGVFGAWALR